MPRTRAHPKKHQRLGRTPAKGKIRDTAGCRICGDPLWQHVRCTHCDRFVWCTDPAHPQRRHTTCPARPAGKRNT